MDPRPDLTEDSIEWTVVLGIAACLDKGVNPDGVWNALSAARVTGGRLRRSDAFGYTITDMDMDVRRDLMVPNVALIQDVLRLAAKSPRR